MPHSLAQKTECWRNPSGKGGEGLVRVGPFRRPLKNPRRKAVRVFSLFDIIINNPQSRQNPLRLPAGVFQWSAKRPTYTGLNRPSRSGWGNIGRHKNHQKRCGLRGVFFSPQNSPSQRGVKKGLWGRLCSADLGATGGRQGYKQRCWRCRPVMMSQGDAFF